MWGPLVIFISSFLFLPPCGGQGCGMPCRDGSQGTRTRAGGQGRGCRAAPAAGWGRRPRRQLAGTAAYHAAAPLTSRRRRGRGVPRHADGQGRRVPRRAGGPSRGCRAAPAAEGHAPSGPPRLGRRPFVRHLTARGASWPGRGRGYGQGALSAPRPRRRSMGGAAWSRNRRSAPDGGSELHRGSTPRGEREPLRAYFAGRHRRRSRAAAAW